MSKLKEVLEQIFHELNQLHFGGSLPLPKLLWNQRLRSSAGRFSPGSTHLLKPRAPTIEVASYLKELPDGTFHTKDTMLHEMVHYYLWHKKRPYGHTPEFNQILRRVGARRYNPVPKLGPVKYWYKCPNCAEKIPAKRKLSLSACAPCCKKYNKGEFSHKFILKISLEGGIEEQKKVETAQPLLSRLHPNEIIQRLESLKAILKSAKR